MKYDLQYTYNVTRTLTTHTEAEGDTEDDAISAGYIEVQREVERKGGGNVKLKSCKAVKDRYHYVKGDLNFDPPEDRYGDHAYSLVTSFSSIDNAVGAPEGGDGCHWYGRKLEEAKVVTSTVEQDHESSCCYFYFKRKRDALSFLNRLNKWIDSRIKQVEALA